MMREGHPLTFYRVHVRDPKTGEQVSYRFRDHSPEAADATARAGFTGLLGGTATEEARKRLEVKVVQDLRQSP